MELSGAVALVTGAGRRLGRTFALALAARGAKLAVHYSSSSAGAQETVESIRAQGGVAAAFAADLSDAAAAAALAAEVARRMGPCRVLINSASMFKPIGFGQATAQDWDAHFALNLRAPFLLAQAMLATLPADAQGKVINIGDWHTTNPSHFPYGVTKAALTGLTRSLAISMAPRVQVNEVALGAILAPAGGVAAADGLRGRDPKSIAKLRLVERTGDPDEVAQAIIALLENDYVTGQTLNVTGGVDVW